MKTLRFIAVYGMQFGLLYAWLSFGSMGAYRVEYAITVISTVLLALCMFSTRANLLTLAGKSVGRFKFVRTFDIILAVVWIWNDHAWLGSFYMAAVLILIGRVTEARDKANAKEAA